MNERSEGLICRRVEVVSGFFLLRLTRSRKPRVSGSSVDFLHWNLYIRVETCLKILPTTGNFSEMGSIRRLAMSRSHATGGCYDT